MAGVTLGHQMAGGGDEIGKRVDLLFAFPVLVPGVTLFLAATDMRDGVDEAAIDQRQAVGVEGGGHRHAVGAVTVEQAGGGAVER